MAIMIRKARELGFCFGVRRAIKIIEKAAKKYEGIATLGPIVHNQMVVARLAGMGISVANDLSCFQGDTIAIASHGVSPDLMSQIQARQIRVIDTTCPIVRGAQKAARKLSDSGFDTIIFGEAIHSEVEGLLGWAGNKSIATMDSKELINAQMPRRLGVLSQTTQSRSKFAEFVKEVISVTFPYTQELRVVNTLCDETQKRQAAALDLARESDLMIVVGGYSSANTQRLAELCAPIAETYLIEAADEIEGNWIAGIQHIGITAGASTPDEAIEDVILRLNSVAGG